MLKAEYQLDFLQRDGVERKEYAEVRSIASREEEERDGVEDLLEKILDRENLNRAFKKVKRNNGAPGVDGMNVLQALTWIKENREELLLSIRNGTYKPNPVRRTEIPKPDGGTRKLGIPTVVDRVIQQAITQQIQPIFEPIFSDSSFGYRPKRSGPQAIRKVKAYAEEGYIHAVEIDLSKYFDTLNHELLLNIIRRKVQDQRVIKLIKKYLKSGVMENGVVSSTEEGTPQGGPLSPILAKSKRAGKRLLESSQRLLEGKLKLKINREKSRAVSVFATKRFKFLGFCLGKNGKGVYIRAHRDSLAKAKKRLKALTKRSQGKSARVVFENVKVFIRGWLVHYSTAELKRILMSWNEWLRRRMRMYIWKQWKNPRTRVKNLRKLGISLNQAYQWGNSRLGYWRIAGSPVLQRSITNEKLIKAGYYDFEAQYEKLRERHLSG